jgi:hypothetical protein
MHTFYTITPGAIQHLKGCSQPTARKEFRRVREVLQLQPKEPLKLRDLAAAWDCTVDELAQTLYLSAKKKAA